MGQGGEVIECRPKSEKLSAGWLEREKPACLKAKDSQKARENKRW